MRIVFSLYLLLLAACVSAQSSPESVSNIQVRYRNIDDPNVLPVSVNSASYGDSKVEMEITFTVSNPDSISVLEIKTGRQQSTSDILSAALVFSKENNKNYYTCNGKKQEIENNTVVFTEQVPENTLKKSSYVSLNATDRKNRKSNTFTKKVN
jgi:hypothetical protein